MKCRGQTENICNVTYCDVHRALFNNYCPPRTYLVQVAKECNEFKSFNANRYSSKVFCMAILQKYRRKCGPMQIQ